MYDQFTADAQAVIRAAERYSRELLHATVDPEHLLMALIAGGGPTAQYLGECGLNTDGLIMRMSRRPKLKEASSTPKWHGETTQLLEQALTLASEKGQSRAEPYHILLAFSRPAGMLIVTSLRLTPWNIQEFVNKTFVTDRSHPPLNDRQQLAGQKWVGGITTAYILQTLASLIWDRSVEQLMVQALIRRQPNLGRVAIGNVRWYVRGLGDSNRLTLPVCIENAVALRELVTLLEETGLLHKIHPDLPAAATEFANRCYEVYLKRLAGN